MATIAIHDLDELARDQHGLITRKQLLKFGGGAWIDQLVQAGVLVRETPSVYRLCGVPRSWEQRALAAAVSARTKAVVSHRSAAYLWGLIETAPGRIDLTVARHSRPRRRSGLRAHETLALHLAGETLRRSIPVTGVARTILDCCAVTEGDMERLSLLDEARRLRLVEWDELWECLLLHAVRGRPGVSRFREILVKRSGKVPAHGDFPRLMARLLEDAGLPEPVFEYHVEIDGHHYRIDLSWPDIWFGIECLGKVGHDFEAAYEKDPVRRNHLLLAGWTILEFTWERFRDEPRAVVAEVHQAFLRSSRAVRRA